MPSLSAELVQLIESVMAFVGHHTRKAQVQVFRTLHCCKMEGLTSAALGGKHGQLWKQEMIGKFLR